MDGASHSPPAGPGCSPSRRQFARTQRDKPVIPGLRRLLAGATAWWRGLGGCFWPQISEVGWGGPRLRLTPQAPLGTSGLVLLRTEKPRQELVSAEPQPGACQQPPSPASHGDSDPSPCLQGSHLGDEDPPSSCLDCSWAPGLDPWSHLETCPGLRPASWSPTHQTLSFPGLRVPHCRPSVSPVWAQPRWSRAAWSPRAPPPAPRSPNLLVQMVVGAPSGHLKITWWVIY